jgi:hypothetical protein
LVLLREYLQWMYPFRPGIPHLHATGAGVCSDIESLPVFGLVEQSIVATTSTVHTHDVAELELDNPVHQILLGSLGTPRVVKLGIRVLGRQMVPAINTEFHTITYR